MKIKTKEELSALDEELNLFDESDWSFLNVSDGCNLEYFNDIKDDDFRKRTKKDYIRYVFVALTVCLVYLVGGVWLYDAVIGRYILPDDNMSIVQDVEAKKSRVQDASAVNSDEFIELTRVLSSYFNVLKHKSSYNILDEFCLTSSTFCETEKLYRDKMEYSYDVNDCYSRALRCFGSYFTVSHVNEVLYKEGTYYVYANLNYPDNDALTEYFYIYGNDMTKFFTSNEITEQNVVRYILQLSDTYGLPSSEREVCIEMCKDTDGNYVILDDSIVTSQCTTAYNYAISQVVKILGANKATTQYD